MPYLLFLGLDNAGKSTLMYYLIHGTMKLLAPSMRPTLEDYTLNSNTYTLVDLCGVSQAQSLWQDYYILSGDSFRASTGIVFVIDAFNQARLKEAGKSLKKFIVSITDRKTATTTINNPIPILVVFTKIDLFVKTTASNSSCDNESFSKEEQVSLTELITKCGIEKLLSKQFMKKVTMQFELCSVVDSNNTRKKMMNKQSSTVQQQHPTAIANGLQWLDDQLSKRKTRFEKVMHFVGRISRFLVISFVTIIVLLFMWQKYTYKHE